MAGRLRVAVSLPGGLASALVAALAALTLRDRVDIAFAAILGGAMAAVALEDLKRLRLPDVVLYPAAAFGLVAAAAEARADGLDVLPAVGWAALAMIVSAFSFLAIREVFHRLRGVDGLGLGDVKLAGVGGAWLGWQGFATAVMIAAFAALVFVAVRVAVRGPWPAAKKIPLALFLAPVIWGVWYGIRLEAIAAP